MTDLDEANALLAARVAELDARFHGHDGLPTAYVPLASGGIVVYEKLCINGIVEQGRSIGYALTPKEAARLWIEASLIYEDPDLVGTLFWRRRPRLEYGEVREQSRTEPDGEWSEFWTSYQGWRVYARLVIANGEPGFDAEKLANHPEDFPDDMRALMVAARERYFAARKTEATHG